MTTYTIGTGGDYTTYSEMFSAGVLTSGDIVDGQGLTFRETVTPNTSGITLTNAIILGSESLSGASWGLHSGSTYKTLLPEVYLACVYESIITKLIVGTDEDSLSANQFFCADGYLYINIEENPTGKPIEYAVRNAGIYIDSLDNIIIDGVDSFFTNIAGVILVGTGVGCAVANGTFSYNAKDGVDIFDNHTGVTISACTCQYNDSALDGAGEGISFHNDASGVVEGCNLNYNYHGARDMTTGTVEYNNNNMMYNERSAYEAIDSYAGTLVFNGNIMVGENENLGSGLFYVPANSLYSITVINNIIVGKGVKGTSRGIRCRVGTVTARNNIITGFFNGIYNNGGTVNETYTCFDDNTYNMNPATAIDVTSIEDDPLFIDEVDDNYSLSFDSPTIPANIAEVVTKSVPQPKAIAIKSALESQCTLLTRATMGVGSDEVVIGEEFSFVSSSDDAQIPISYGKDATGSYIASSDGTNTAKLYMTWSRGDDLICLPEVSAAGSQLRIGAINATLIPDYTIDDVTWSSLVAFDGSFNPLDYLRFAFDTTVPIYIKQVILSNLGGDAETLIEESKRFE